MRRRLVCLVALAVHTASALVAPGSTLIVGGGFAGLYTALNLAKSGRPVTLVDSREKFAFLPLLYEYAVGLADEDEVSTSFEDVCGSSGVTFVRGDVASLDLSTRVASLSDGRQLSGEALIVALGKEPILDGAPGVLEHALPFYRLEHAARLRSALEVMDGGDGKTIVVVGGGYTGVELACHLRARRPKDVVTLLDRGDRLGRAT